ncbi:hypothetical protein RUND412_003039 [Rhizina undulata]
MAEVYTSVHHLLEEIQSFSDYIRKVIHLLETSADKKHVRLAALGALLTTIREADEDGLWDYIPDLHTEWMVYHATIVSNVLAALPPPTYPDIAFAEFLVHVIEPHGPDVEEVTSPMHCTNITITMASNFNASGNVNGGERIPISGGSGPSP